MVVRARRVLAGGDDREVHLLVALGEDPGRQLGGHLGLGAADERDVAGVELGGDPVDGGARCGERVDLGLVLDHPQRADHVDGTAVAGVRELREQLDEEPRPHLIADREGAGRRTGSLHQPGDDRGRVIGLAPGQQAEHAGLFGDAAALRAGG